MILKAAGLVNLANANIDQIVLPASPSKNVSVSVLRTDKIHAIISGNKWFKLKYNIENALQQNKKHIITFGGAWSNHIVATACLCHEVRLQSTGIIRGEKPQRLSYALQDATSFGMELRYVSRELYRNKQSLITSLQQDFPESFIIEEGGQNELGIRGAGEILQLIHENKFTHIACAVGTGTMMTGLIRASAVDQKLIGIPVLKLDEENNEIEKFIHSASAATNYQLFYNYHFGGYAKHNNELLSFMDSLLANTGIPTDFVYTGKLFYAVNDLIEQEKIPTQANILIIHSGGLQGNRGLMR